MIEMQISPRISLGVQPASVRQVGEPTTRSAVLALQAAMLTQPDQLCIDEMTSHYFAPGLYARQFDMLAGDLVVGKIHKHSHLITLLYGEVTVTDEFNNVRITGPSTWVSTPGVKRAVYAHTACSFMTFHPTDSLDLVEIEKEVIAPSYEELDTFLLGIPEQRALQ